MDERRKNKRIGLRLPINLKVTCANGVTESYTGIALTDISEKGFGFFSSKQLNAPVSIQFHLPAVYSEDPINNLIIESNVEMTWSRPSPSGSGYHYGFVFENMDPDCKNMLLDIIKYELKENTDAASAVNVDLKHSNSTRVIYIPKDKEENYKKEFINKRRDWLRERTGAALNHIGQFSVDTETMKGNAENVIGVVQIPLGIAGPLKINGQYAKGDFYVPMATTEGALVMTYDLGMRVITKSGGANARIIKDEIHISPVFIVGDLREVEVFIGWLNSNFAEIKRRAEVTTKHGKLLRIEPIKLGMRVVVKFVYTTGDAQGLNMVNRATDEACKYICHETQKKHYHRSNYSGIKKLNMDNIYQGMGKAVEADVVVPRNVVRALRATPEEIVDLYNTGILANSYAGMVGRTAHVANGVTAVFMACGQDVADVSVSHVGFTAFEVTDDKDLYVSLYIPNLFVGTVGGGTGLGPQRECLEILGCFGAGKAKKFAEIVAATALAGEIAVMAALVNGSYVEAHEKYGRNRPAEG